MESAALFVLRRINVARFFDHCWLHKDKVIKRLPTASKSMVGRRKRLPHPPAKWDRRFRLSNPRSASISPLRPQTLTPQFYFSQTAASDFAEGLRRRVVMDLIGDGWRACLRVAKRSQGRACATRHVILRFMPGGYLPIFIFLQ